MERINFFNLNNSYDPQNLKNSKNDGTGQKSSSSSLFGFGWPKMSKSNAIPNSKKSVNPTNNVDTNWVKTYKNYTPKNKAKYNKVYTFVKNFAKKQGNITANLKEITNMVCKLSERYQIDPEITATILAHETGGFVFTPKVLSARDNYKGVGQVDRNVVDCLYADPDYNSNKKYPSKRDEALSYDTKHWMQDKTRVFEIKKKYPTPKALWNAIQKDVSLGLEVGIIAFKMKLHSRKGNAVAALRDYCSGQYSMPADSTAQKKYSLPLPAYKYA